MPTEWVLVTGCFVIGYASGVFRYIVTKSCYIHVGKVCVLGEKWYRMPRKFMFPDGERIFTVGKHTFSDGKLTFTIAEHKHSPRENIVVSL